MVLITAEKRVPARMPGAVYEKINEAAAMVGATLNQFLVSAAIEKANVILEQERVINLSAESAKIVFDLMDNPPKPNKHLKRALQARKELFCK
ncbi:MAG: DUF1778 domain-containing protein [Pseudomonadota bacterium]